MRSDPDFLRQAPPQDYHLHYGLAHAPFSIESDTSLFVLSEGHEHALDTLHRGLLGRKSFLLITGAPGTGKTLLLQTLMALTTDECQFLRVHSEDLASQRDPTTPIANHMSALVLAAAGVTGATDVPRTGSCATERRADSNAQLRRFFESPDEDQRPPVIVIDEAQRLTDEALETLRCWSNLDNHNGRALQCILAGHTELADRLNTPLHASLKQRIGMRCELKGLSLGDCQRYIEHRISLAGAPRPLFDAAVVRRIYSLSQGIPRLINTVADALLLHAFLRGARAVTLEDVATVSNDLDLHYAPIVNTKANTHSTPPARQVRNPTG